MKYKLSHIQKEYSCKLEEITDFLSKNGYDIKPHPNTEVSEEIKLFIDFNFEKNITTKNSNIPLEIKLLDAVNSEKLLIERIIGFTDFEWKYLVSTYSGEVSQPIPFTTFDEVICDILLEGKELSKKEIGEILGLDVENDPASNDLLSEAIKLLKEPGKDGQMIDGDDSVMWLTDIGKEYAKNGVKYSTFKKEFKIYWDIIGNKHDTAKESLSKINSVKIPIENEINPSENIDNFKKVVELQAPEVHYPEKGFNLLNYNHIKTEGYFAKVWVCFLENFKDNTTRVIVYDETQNKTCPHLSEILNKKDDIKDELIEKLILTDETVEVTNDAKPEEQIKLEEKLINKQIEFDEALKNKELEKIKKINSELTETKNHFNTLEFELELKHLFETTKDEIWIISPWIKKHAFRKRKQFIEPYLKKGGKVFIAYSKAEENNKTSQMVDEESMNDLLELEKNYTNFYFCELPQFHYKNVWLRKNDKGFLYYTGSFNILSFFVHQNQKYIRQEKMVKLEWNNEIEEKFYNDVYERFSVRYFNLTTDKLNNFSLLHKENITENDIKELEALGNEKLKPFLNNKTIKDKLKEFNDAKNFNLKYFRKLLFEKHIEEYKEKVESLHNNKMTRSEKSNLLKDFKNIREKNDDLLELQMKAFEVQTMIENIEVIGKKKYPKSKKRKNRK